MGGHYQMVEKKGGKVFVAFNYHPRGVVDERTNLYFVSTEDRGETWQTIDGSTIATPMTDIECAALVRDFGFGSGRIHGEPDGHRRRP